MNNSGNQIRAKMIASYPKSDRAKLAGLEKYFHRKYPQWTVKLEYFMVFSKGEDEFLGLFKTLPKEAVVKHKIHPPDVWLARPEEKPLILELDGPWHDVHVKETLARNRLFELNDLPYFVVNETDLKHELGIPKSGHLLQWQIDDAFDEKIKKITS